MSTSTTTSTKNSGKETIAKAVVERAKSLLIANTSAKVDDDFKSGLYNFLMEKEFWGGIRVFLSKEPATDDVKAFSINETHIVTVAFGKNSRKEMYPYILSVSVSKKPVAIFKSFWENRSCPVSLFDEAVSKLNLDLPIHITVFQSPRVWNEFRKKFKHYEFIGQTPDEKTGSFIPTIPIGYVDSKTNSVTITNPSLSRASICYVFDLSNR